jgi:hypothetical protein
VNNGFVALRRGILDHLADGRINGTEFQVLVALILDAHAGTGSGTINAPKLNALWLQDASNDTAKRVLASLEEKGYILRDIPFKSKRAYRYWVHKYQCSKGANEMLYTDVSQARVSNRVKDIRYVKVAPDILPDVPPEMPPDVSPEMPPDVPHSYNKDTDKNKDTYKDKSSSPSLKRSKDANRGSANVRRYRDANSGSGTVSQGLKLISDAEPDATKRGDFLTPLSGASSPAVAPVAIRLRFQYGEDPGWFDGSRKVGFAEANEHLASMGMELRGPGEIYEGGVMIPWKEAVERIEGATK